MTGSLKKSAALGQKSLPEIIVWTDTSNIIKNGTIA
jgi:hypothetical protein